MRKLTKLDLEGMFSSREALEKFIEHLEDRCKVYSDEFSKYSQYYSIDNVDTNRVHALVSNGGLGALRELIKHLKIRR